MTETLQLARPVVGATARFHANQARRQIHEELSHLVTPDLLLDDRLAKLIDAVQLKHILSQIDAYCCNLYIGRSCL